MASAAYYGNIILHETCELNLAEREMGVLAGETPARVSMKPSTGRGEHFPRSPQLTPARVTL